MSPRERFVFDQYCAGYSFNEIGIALNLSTARVGQMYRGILRKLKHPKSGLRELWESLEV